MINNILVGSPIQGAPGVKVPDRDSKAPPGSDSFGEVLNARTQDAKVPDRKTEKDASKGEPKETRIGREQNKTDSGKKDKAEAKSKNDEPKAEKSNESVETKSAKPNSRKQAIQKFMDSFESEFGIPSTRLVESIANLNPTEQEMMPEDTAQEVIGDLGLDKESEQRAMQMYAGLLADLKSQPVVIPVPLENGEALVAQKIEIVDSNSNQADAMAALIAKSKSSEASASTATASSSAKMPALSVDSLAKLQLDSELQSSMDAAQEFDADELSAAPMDSEAMVPENEIAKQVPNAKLENSLSQLKAPVQEMSPLALAALIAKQQSAKAAQGTAESSIEGAINEGASVDANQSPSSTIEAMLKNQISKMQGQQEAPLQMRQLMDEYRQQGSGQQFNGQASASKSANLPNESKGDLKTSEFKSTLDALSPHLMPLKTDMAKLEGPIAAAATAATLQPTPADQEANIKQILSQAQILVKKGGGEMSLRMSPEGMGEIHLKVLMQDGKMSMQMQAESKEAKQAIESSLAELKTSLAAHKLSMDHVKVDVVSSTNTENSTNNQMNMNSQGGQDQAKKFWNSFNENFGSNAKRESFFNSPNSTGYGSKKTNPLQPIETSERSSVRAVSGRGQGLNLVA